MQITFFPVCNALSSSRYSASSDTRANLRARIYLSYAFESIDSYFFTRVDDKLFLNVSSAKETRSYQDALKKYLSEYPYSARTIDKVVRSKPIQYFIAKRNLQILKALQGTKPQAVDPTTQRTAEEIKMLVENLDPENPLRQAIEGTLKDNGYIAPAE